ncbi:MAG: pyridoxal phosphate enzyme (YggS family) [Lysobacterales bacterium]|jgi:pyridoxal phosphate enzyme (YggS family)
MQGLENLRLRLRSACELVNRNPSEVRLLAVGKKHPALSIRQLFEQGQTEFGENQLQEARQKQQELADLPIQWHFIGHLQSNKAQQVSEHFDWVQSVDRLKILNLLSTHRPASLKPLNICLQVNIDRETQKSGLMPEQVLELAQLSDTLPGIKLRGLMAIPKASSSPTETTDSFKRVYDQYADLCSRGFDLDTLSMGMSSDLEAAIAQGSTMVRIGTDLFGPRPIL